MEFPAGTVLLDQHFGTTVVNATDIPTSAVHEAMGVQDRAMLSSLSEWVQATRPSRLDANSAGSYESAQTIRNGGLFCRDRYVTPSAPFDQMRLAYEAVETDDIVSGILESTESLAFSAMSFFAADKDEQDAYNQMAAVIDLDSRMREIWRELFTVSQAYIAVWWEQQSYKIRGTTKNGNQRRKTVSFVGPTELTLLDPLKVIPVGSTLFQKEQLAYIAAPIESERFQSILGAPEVDDEIVSRLIVGPYRPDRQEELELNSLGVNTRHLYLLNPKNVFRHTLTRPSYQRLSPVRMKPVFELLDMKNQLRQMERAHLIGGPLRVDQRVPTPEGWKPIGAVEVGDAVYSVDGQTTRIVGVFPQGVLPMYKVTFTDGAEVYCDETHPWTVHDRQGRQRTIRLGQILAEGLRDPNGSSSVHRHRIPVAEPLDLPVRDLPLDPYLLGHLVSHGSHTGKFIPDDYLWASIEQRWALLQGLCDSDGHSSVAGVVEYTTVSEKLAGDVVQLAQSLGCLARQSVRAVRPNEQLLHRVNISVGPNGQPFRLERKALAWRPRRHPLVRAITAIERSLDGEAVCIKTDREDGLFLTESMVVTHNTNFILVITKGTDQLPAQAAEISNLQAMVRTIARVPVLVGDHRLNVEIVTPKLDSTLRAERWNTIDGRITGRLYQMFVLGNYCQSEDTEILTSEGWKTHDQLSPGDVVLTLDTDTQTSVWQSCTAVNRFEHDDVMLSLEGRSHSSMSTMNHRWWVEEQFGANREWRRKFVTSDELTYRHRIPTAVPHSDFPSEPKHSDAFVELVAWWWTEGHIREAVKGGYDARREHSQISQSHAVNSAHVASIRAACHAVFGAPGFNHWRENSGANGMTVFTFNHELHNEFVAVCPNKVPSPAFLRSLTYSQLRLFIDTSISADGHVESKGRRTFAQMSRARVDAFEMACALAGVATSSRVDSNGLTRISLLTTTYTNPIRAAYYNDKDPECAVLTRYRGIVWCPTTPNGTWFARRNGTVYWTGNSAGASGDDSIKLAKFIARGMESRRHMIRRSLEKYIFRPMWENNDELTSFPKLEFHPRSIALDFDAAYASFLFDLRQANELSRETILNQFDLDQELEAEYRRREQEEYDDVFKTQVPFSTPNPALPNGTPPTPDQEPLPLPRDNGGGRRNGGGAAPGTGQGQPPRRRPQRPAAAGEHASGLPIPDGDSDPEGSSDDQPI